MNQALPRWRDEVGASLEAFADRIENDLAGSATVTRETLKDLDIRAVDIEPRTPRATQVGWLDMVDELQVAVGGRGPGGRWELGRTAVDVRFVEDVVTAAIRGDVLQVLGRGRSRVEVTMPDGEVVVATTFEAPGGCLPIPGWVRFGRGVQYAPYTSPR